MSATTSWDWQPGESTPLQLAVLSGGAEIIEFAPSPDGLRLAAVVADDDGMRVRILGPGDEVVEWPETWERVRQLKWSDSGSLAAIIGQDYTWTVVVDGEAWPDTYEFLWDLRHAADGRLVASIKTDDGYGLATAGEPWSRPYPMVREWCLSPQGARAACTVQVEAKKEADTAAFASGLWSLAVDGEPWSRQFVNVWEPCFSLDGQRTAALVRLSRTEHTVAVDGEPWPQAFGCAWGPIFTPGGSVVAPIKTGTGWTLGRDGKPDWSGRFTQVWRQVAAADGRVAAVVAPEFGNWTVAVDGKPWSSSWDEWAGTPVFADGDDKRVASAVKSGGRWSVAVDGRPWDLTGERLLGPLILPNGGPVLARIERDGCWQLAMDGRPVGGSWNKLWPITVGPEGDRLLIRGLDRNGDYRRQILTLADLRQSERSPA